MPEEKKTEPVSEISPEKFSGDVKVSKSQIIEDYGFECSDAGKFAGECRRRRRGFAEVYNEGRTVAGLSRSEAKGFHPELYSGSAMSKFGFLPLAKSHTFVGGLVLRFGLKDQVSHRFF